MSAEPLERLDRDNLLEELVALLEEVEAMQATYGAGVGLCRGRPMVDVDTGAYL